MTRGEPLGVLDLVGRTLRLFVRSAGFLLPLAFAPALALAAVAWAVGGAPTPPAPGDPAGPPALGAAGLAAVVLDVVVGFVITGIMCLAALDAALGKRHTVRDYLAQTLRRLGPIVVLGILLSVATALGAVLFIVPGLYVAARWLPWAPAIVFEDLGWAGLGRAQALTEGYRWPLVGASVLMGFAMVALTLLLAPLLFASAAAGAAFGILAEAAISAVYYGLIAVFTALAYLRLRALKEGMDAAAVAATID
jgi:hypothetical protein